VQPGDGGFGLVVQTSGYQLLNHSGSLAAYFAGTYIIEPEGDSGLASGSAGRAGWRRG